MDWLRRQIRYALRYFFDKPYPVGHRVELLPERQCNHWVWCFPPPLYVIGVERTPTNWSVEEGYIYAIRDGTGSVNSFHEKWVVSVLRSTLEREREGILTEKFLTKRPQKEIIESRNNSPIRSKQWPSGLPS